MNKVQLGDWLNNNIPDKSIDVIMADPPYFEVKGDFDFIWKSFDDYLKDVEKWAIECKRVLKDNGSLFWWGHAKKIAYAQIIFDKYFNLENSLVWEKPDAQTNKTQFRCFNPVTERCLFYSNEIVRVNGLCVNNARDYIRKEIERAKGKVVLKDINKAIGTAFNGGGVASAVLSLEKAEPCMITEEHYIKLRDWLNQELSREYLRAEYEYLRAEYEELRAEYEELRRPFCNPRLIADVFRYSQESHVSRLYEHDTIKSLTVIKMLLGIATSSKHNKVLIPFGGSGTDVEACIDLGLDYECYEIDEKHYNTIKAREKKALQQPTLF